MKPILPTLYRKTTTSHFLLRDGSRYDDFESCKEELRKVKNDDGEFIIAHRFERSEFDIIEKLEIAYTSFKTMKGFEYNIRYLDLIKNGSLASLEGLEQCRVKKLIVSGNCNLVSFHNVHKHLKGNGSSRRDDQKWIEEYARI